jgi:DNA-binding MarR family transcriptional regulator
MVIVTPTTSVSIQGRILEAIGFHQPTTIREIAARTGFTFATVTWHLPKLREQGLVAETRKVRRDRTIRLTSAGEAAVRARLSA